MLRLLAIDGGGLRGIIPVQILKHIENITQKKIIDSFEIFAGTSTGGLISVGLTVPSESPAVPMYTVDDIENIYLNKSATIFPIYNQYYKWLRSKSWSYLTCPQFTEEGITEVFTEFFGVSKGSGLRIQDCIKPIFVPAYDLVTNSPIYFTSRGAYAEPKRNALLIDVCRATSAGPTYLPTYSFDTFHRNKYFDTNTVTTIDGGVFMNNPTMGILIEIFKYRKAAFYNFDNIKDDEIYILSLGTGRYSKDISKDSKYWGKLKWIAPLTDIMMWGNNQAVDFQVEEFMKFTNARVNYLRINVNVLHEEYSDMANSDKECLAYLQKRVEEDFFKNAEMQNRLTQFLVDAEILT